MSIVYCFPKNLLVYDSVIDKLFTVDEFQINLYNVAKNCNNNEIKNQNLNNNVYYYGKTHDLCWYMSNNGNKIYFISLLNLMVNNSHELKDCKSQYNKGLLDYGVEIVLPHYLIYDLTVNSSNWFAANYIQNKLCNLIFEHSTNTIAEIPLSTSYINKDLTDIVYICEKKSDYYATYNKLSRNYAVLNLKYYLEQLKLKIRMPSNYIVPLGGKKSRRL
jgi:hypothetical protein